MAAVESRLVDQYPSHRTKPMKVICLGASRTGTLGFQTAMNKLGYNCWHLGTSFLERPARDMPLLAEALNLKESRESTFGNLGPYPGDPASKPPAWGRREWDVILGDYDACADNPVASFVDDMLQAYPDAKIVLTMRDVDAWLKSLSNSAGVVLNWWSWPYVAPWDAAAAGPWWTLTAAMGRRQFNDFTRHSPMRQAFLNHYAYVKKVVPPERLLEFDLSQGWEPLCKFLDKPIPQEPYPHVNESQNFIQMHAVMWWMAVGKMVLKVGAVAAVPFAGWMYWNRYKR